MFPRLSKMDRLEHLQGSKKRPVIEHDRQILHFVRPKFSVIIQMTGNFFLEKLEEFVRDTLKALEIV